MELPIKVNGILFYKDKILVVKRTEEDGEFWQTITGTLEDGESLKEVMIREIEEEAGITDIQNVSSPVHKFMWDKKGWIQTEYVFAVSVNTDKVKLSEEHDDYKRLIGMMMP